MKILNSKIPVIDFGICTHCEKCIEACKEKAIHKGSNESCGRCIKYCLSMTIPCKPDMIHFDYELCTACGDCLAICPEKAMHWYFPKQKEEKDA